MSASSFLATLTHTGRAALLLALAERTLFFAWGTGDASWDDDPAQKPLLITATELVGEVGRRMVDTKAFVTPDPDGSITLPEGYNADGTPIFSRYALSEQPTPHLYLRVTFDYGDAWQHVIREVGIFCDAVTDPALPPGQRYFEPHQVLQRGRLIAARHEQAGKRDPARRDTYEFVLSL